jgi:hypothetical protein
MTRRRRVLSLCLGVPEWGDANPWAYALHEILGQAGFEALLVNLLTDSDVFYFRHLLGDDCEDPRRLGNVSRCPIGDPIAHGDVALGDTVASFAPDVAIAWETTTARLLRRAAAQLPLVLVSTHCARLERLVADGAVRDYLGFRSAAERGVQFTVDDSDPELVAIRACDLLILPSELARFSQERLFPAQVGKMYARTISAAEPMNAEASRFLHLRRPFAERDIDVLFVSGRWDTPARQLQVVDRICARVPHRRVELVGESSTLTRARHRGVRPRRALYELLGRTKVVVAPGLADPAPAGLFEASAMACNLVASPNCGPWELCPEELRVPDASTAAFVEQIERALARPFADDRQRFLDGATSELVETLAVL